MSTSEILSVISLVSFVLAGISFLFAVFFWIRFNIPAVIGDLSGRTARKSIERMRESNEKTGDKSHRSSKVNLGRGKLTDTMPGSDKRTGDLKPKFAAAEIQPETGLLAENSAMHFESEETGLLMEDNETALLNESVFETELLEHYVSGEETEETGLLAEAEENEMESRALETGNIKFVLLEEVMLIHTNEVI